MIAIIDYGMGNHRSVQKALEYIGAQAVVTKDLREIESAQALILPGVGAFRDAISALKSGALDSAFSGAVRSGKPCLGICLGMQLMFNKSLEFGERDGLGLIDGEISLIKTDEKIPHVGWNNVCSCFKNPILDGVDGADFYFVHSYCAQDISAPYAAGLTRYGENEFVSVIASQNLFGTQFHPEKSGDAGLQLLKNFCKLAV